MLSLNFSSVGLGYLIYITLFTSLSINCRNYKWVIDQSEVNMTDIISNIKPFDRSNKLGQNCSCGTQWVIPREQGPS